MSDGKQPEKNITEDIKEKVTDSSVWLRLLFIFLFAILYSAAEVVLTAVVVFQFLYVLFTGNKNDNALKLGAQLSTYAYQVCRYVTYNSEERPFPFADWPAGTGLSEAQSLVAAAPPRPASPAKKVAPARRKEASKAASKQAKPANSD